MEIAGASVWNGRLLVGGADELLDGHVRKVKQWAVRRGLGPSFSATSSFCGVTSVLRLQGGPLVNLGPAKYWAKAQSTWIPPTLVLFETDAATF